MGKGDHIVIPKSVLRRFTDKNKKVTSLNLLDNSTHKIPMDSIFTEENYYLNEVDKFIKDNVETQIGELYKIISDNKNNSFKLKIKFLENFRFIFFIQYFRNNNFSKKLGNVFIEKKIMHNISLDSIIQYLEKGVVDDEELKRIYEEMDKEYSKYTPGFIIIDSTSRSFLLPASQFTYISIKNSGLYIYPIGPNIALIWKLDSQKRFEYGYTNDDKAIEKINILMVEQEKSKKKDYIVFGKEDEIIKIRNCLNSKQI